MKDGKRAGEFVVSGGDAAELFETTEAALNQITVFIEMRVNRHEKPIWHRKLNRAEWLKVLLNMIESGCEIRMEACGGAHHWAPLLFEGITDDESWTK